MIGHLWARHRWLLMGFAAALALALFFGVRAAVLAVLWSGHQDETLAGWMTPRYVAMSWDVPPEVVGEALAIAQDGSGRRLTLAEIAAARGVPLAALEAELADAIAAYRAGE